MFPFEKKANPASSTAGTLSATGVNVIVKQGVVANDVLVAHFRADGRFQSANNYKATISWGDDTPSTPGVITPSNDWSDGASSMIGISAWSNDSFCITGSHIYATAGRFSIGVTAYAERGSSTLVSTNALIGSLNERFIAQAYLDLLHHTIDQHRLSRWSQLLDYGTTRSQVVLEILNTKEYRKYLVESLYRLFLHQPANSKQLKQGLQSLESGITFTQFKANILSSQEYFQKRGLETNEGFLAALYIDVMGRTIAPHEALSWSQKLEEGDSRATIAEAVLKSLEAELNVVRSYGQQFLHQTADNRVLSTTLDALRHGEPLEKVIAHILGSDEYLYSSVGTQLFLPPGGPRLIVAPILEVDADFNNPNLGQVIPLDLGKVSPLWASALVGGKTFLRNEQPEFEWVPIFSPHPLVDLESTWSNHNTKTPPWGDADIERVNRMYNESDYDSGLDRLVGITGTAVVSPGTIPDPNDPNKQIPDPHPEISKNDIPFTHPFGNDFEFDLAPDPTFWELLAVTDLDLKRCGLGWFDVVPNVRDALAIANDPNGLNLGVPGVIHIESEQGLIPSDYRPDTGDRVVLFGRWIVDAGHNDFQTEIHPPFLVARAYQPLLGGERKDILVYPDPDTTYSTVIGRPYLTSQIFSYDENGTPRGLRAHVEKALTDKLSSISVAVGLGHKDDYITATPVILPGWASSESYQNISDHIILYHVDPITISYDVRPPTPRRSPNDTMLVSFSFIARTDVFVSVTKIDEDTGDYGVKVTISISGYAEPDIPQGQDTTIYVVGDKSRLPLDDTQELQKFVDDKDKAIRDGTDPDVQHWYLTASERGNIADQLQRIVRNGVHMNAFDPSSWPVPLSPLDKQYNGVKDVPADSLPLHRGGFAVDNEQPFPIYGYLEVHWKRA